MGICCEGNKQQGKSIQTWNSNKNREQQALFIDHGAQKALYFLDAVWFM